MLLAARLTKIILLYASGMLAEAEAAYRQENEQLSTEVVLYSVSNYLAGVEVTPATLGQFYTNNMSLYRIPDRVQVWIRRWGGFL